MADTDKNKALADCHKCSSSLLSIVKSNPLKILASVLEKVRAGSCLKLFFIDCNSRLDHFMWVSFVADETPESSYTNCISPFLQTHFFTFYLIHPCDVASGVVGRHPCYSQTFRYSGFRTSHLSTRPCVGHVFRIFIILESSSRRIVKITHILKDPFDNSNNE